MYNTTGLKIKSEDNKIKKKYKIIIALAGN